MPNEFVRRLTGGTVPQDAFWTFAAGPSGEPFIRDGQPVFVERTTDLVDGALYAVWLGEMDSDVIKRIEVTGPNAVVLRSDNPAVRTRTFTRTEDPEVWTDDAGASVRLLIQGRVRWPDDTARAASLLATEAMALFAKTLRYQGD